MLNPHFFYCFSFLLTRLMFAHVPKQNQKPPNPQSYSALNSGNASSAYLTSGYSTPQSAYQSSQSVYGNTGLSNSSG